MKTLELKDTAIKSGDETINYEQLIRSCLDNPPQGGFSMQDMKDRDRIEKALVASNGILELEDADVQNLKNLVSQMRWGVRHKDILALCDAIEQM
ncbi:MAG: hypothetical protein IIA11_06505 [Proteobacteria bacterium]|nr:hypothetical protein [Pseudomonadota bacterium]